MGRGKSLNYYGQDCSLFSIVITPHISPYIVRISFVQTRGSDRKGEGQGGGGTNARLFSTKVSGLYQLTVKCFLYE